ncbi:MAG: peptidylprolyl isomerase [Actinomycetota bacterium]
MHLTRTLAFAASIAIVAAACSSTSDAASDTTTTLEAPPTTVALAAVPAGYAGYRHQPTACGADQPNPVVEMEFDAPGDAGIEAATTVVLATSCGPLEIELDPSVAPETVNSFVFLAESGFFDGSVSHRIIPGFMMQAGDQTATGIGGPGYTIPDEFPAESGYNRGVVAMANAGPGTTGSQFFIMFADGQLPPNYTIFGEVVDGLETLDRIEQLPLGRSATSADPSPSTPLESLYIESVTVSP